MLGNLFCISCTCSYFWLGN